MNSHSLLIFILIFAIVPNIGFFSFASFFLLTIFGILAWIILKKPLPTRETFLLTQWEVLFILLLGAYYYGGYYQDILSTVLGQSVFFMFCIYVYFQIKKKKDVKFYIVLAVFIVLSLLMINGSPHPTVDTFTIIKEAPLKLIRGENPYNSMYSKVYANVTPNYFNYLPISIVYFLPFVSILNDPRYGIIAALIATFYLSTLLLSKKKSTYPCLYSSLFLFLPRSFYMIEHVYLDTLIFFLFLLGRFFYERKMQKLYFLVMSCFFMVKQNIIVLIPLFFKIFTTWKKYIAYFFIPFTLLLFFFIWNPAAFIKNTLSIYTPSLMESVAPLRIKLVVPNVISQFISPSIFPIRYVISVSALIGFCIMILVAREKKITQIGRITLILFFGYFFSYHAFFNSYYLVLLFLIFDITHTKEYSKYYETIKK